MAVTTLHRAPLRKGEPSAIAGGVSILRPQPDGTYLAFAESGDAIGHPSGRPIKRETAH